MRSQHPVSEVPARSSDSGESPDICMLVHPGRVGSTVLAYSLASLPAIMAGEVHNASIYPAGNWWERWDYVEHFRWLFRQRLTLPQPYTEAPARPDARWYVFEYKPFHTGCGAPLAEALERFRAAGVTRFIGLTRQNIIRRYVSFRTAVLRGVWHSHETAKQPPAIFLDLGHVMDVDGGFTGGTALQWLDHHFEVVRPQWESAMAAAGALQLSYERDIEQDPHVAFHKVRDFLGLDSDLQPARHDQSRQNVWPLREMISNFDEVQQALAGTPHAALLED